MEKMDGKTMDIVAENIAKLKELFPEAFTEDGSGYGTTKDTKSTKKIDFEVLKELLGDYVTDKEERYSFTWNGKSKARMLAQTPSTGTLRPCKEESVDWDSTQNLFIEGDNLEVLKLLQKSYHKKVKMIYIDPPYNTGKDFVYKDDFRDNIRNYKEITGQVDGEGRNLSSNPETSGRYHTDWLNMMYPRLKLARNLLKDDGVVFISIDDGEVANLRKICDEIFGEENFVAEIVWQSKSGGGHDEKCIVKESEYMIVYSKQKSITLFGRRTIDDPNYKLSDKHEKERGKYKLNKLDRMMRAEHYSQALNYPIVSPDGCEIWPGNRQEKTGDWNWRWSRSKVEWGLKNDFLEIKKGQNGYWAVYSKQYERMDHNGQPIERDYPYRNVVLSSMFNTTQGGNELLKIFQANIFDYSKPSDFIKYILKVANFQHNDLIIDFFAGSATTAHAVMKLNAEDGGNRKFIMVQLPEATDEKSEAYKSGYKTIAEISKERIRRAAAKIKEENPAYDGDLGFKVFKLDSTNIKPWEVDFDMTERTLEDYISNIKPDRREEDVLYEILVKYGLDLTLPIEELTIAGKQVFNIGMGALIICLSNAITLEVVEGIAKLKDELNPEIMRVVFKDSGFKDDVVKTNAVQILKQAGINDVRSV